MRLKVLALAPLIAATAACAQTHSFSSATELRSAAVNAGLHCTGYNPVEAPEGAASAGACVGGTPAQLVVYSNEESAKKAIAQTISELSAGDGVLSGPNWSIVAVASDLSLIKNEIGGTLVTGR